MSLLKSDACNELFAALAQAQGEMGSVPKKRKSHYGLYADLADVLDTARGPLTKHKLCVSQVIAGGMLTTLLGHASGQWIASELPLKLDVAAQQVGSQTTYFRRYALCAILGIAADEDDDGEGATDEDDQDDDKEGTGSGAGPSAPQSLPKPIVGPATEPLGSPQTPPVPKPGIQSASATEGPSEAMLKRLFAIARNKNWGEEQMRTHMFERFKVSSTRVLTRYQYEQLCNFMEQHPNAKED